MELQGKRLKKRVLTIYKIHLQSTRLEVKFNQDRKYSGPLQLTGTGNRKKYSATRRTICAGPLCFLAHPVPLSSASLCTNPQTPPYTQEHKLQLPLCEWESQSHSINTYTQLQYRYRHYNKYIYGLELRTLTTSHRRVWLPAQHDAMLHHQAL